MNPSYFTTPIKHLVIEDFFTKEANKKILNEMIEQKINYRPSKTGKGETNHRTNLHISYDHVFKDHREESVLLNTMQSLYVDTDFNILLSSMGYPFDHFSTQTINETQVSRYGGKKGESYEWHTDRFAPNDERIITIVYYCFNEPKKFTGGQIELASNIVWKEQPVGELDSKIYEIKNNMAIIFPSINLHRVHTTKSSDNFEDGRFSMNNWIGFFNKSFHNT